VEVCLPDLFGLCARISPTESMPIVQPPREAKPGPCVPANDKEFAGWAPAENDRDAAGYCQASWMGDRDFQSSIQRGHYEYLVL
jgi:hypothetical protein